LRFAADEAASADKADPGLLQRNPPRPVPASISRGAGTESFAAIQIKLWVFQGKIRG
jgi:hypothetical protein